MPRNYNQGKRGRPSIAESYYSCPGAAKNRDAYKSTRTYTNSIYCDIGERIIENALNKYPQLEILLPGELHYYGITAPRPAKSCILEQLGRMKQQNGYSDADVIAAALDAAAAKRRKESAKEIAKSLKNRRLAGMP